MTDTQATAHDPAVMPGDPAMAASDPGHVRGADRRRKPHSVPAPDSGWYKQAAVYPTLSEPWKETSAVLDDLHGAWQTALPGRAGTRGRAMSENITPEPGNDVELDDLELSPADWGDLQVAYNFGLIEPAEGTVEAEAFDRMDAYARREAERIAAADARDAEYARQQDATREAQREAGREAEAGQ